MTVPFPEDRSFIDENGNIREHWHQFLKGIADGQTDDLSTTISEQAETIAALQTSLGEVTEELDGIFTPRFKIITGGSGDAPTFTHNLNTLNVATIVMSRGIAGNWTRQDILNENQVRLVFTASQSSISVMCITFDPE